MKAQQVLLSMLAFTFALPTIARADNFVGLGLGANLSSFTNLDSGTSGSTEFAATAFADWGLSNMWYLETALRYNSFGASEPFNNATVSLSANYLEIPILIKPTFDAGGWFPYLLAGPEIGFKVGEGASVSAAGTSISVSTSEFNTINFAGDFGIGAEIPILDKVRAFVQFDYELGFINVLQSSTGGSAHTRGALISAGASMAF